MRRLLDRDPWAVSEPEIDNRCTTRRTERSLKILLVVQNFNIALKKAVLAISFS